MSKLTAKQELFITEYMKDLNATQAAIRAGYKEDNAYATGAENLRKPQIKNEIDKRLEERAKNNGITAEWVLQNLKEVAERCMQKVPVMYYDKADKEYKQETAIIQNKDGTTTEEGIWRFDANGANKSLELLGKHLKLFTDKVEAETNNTNTNQNMNLSHLSYDELKELIKDE